VRDSILCPFHHHPICSLQLIRQNTPFLFCLISSPFSTWPVHSFCQRTPLRNIYIVHVPQQPLGAHDGTLGIYVNMIKKSICMGLQHAGSLALCNPIHSVTQGRLWENQTTASPLCSVPHLRLNCGCGVTGSVHLLFWDSSHNRQKPKKKLT